MFFRVKQPIKIGGKVFKTCVCYELSSILKETVLELEREGKAQTFEKEVFFANGKLFEKHDTDVSSLSTSVVEETQKDVSFDETGTLLEESSTEKKLKKSVKDF